jgi:hypothetical protein
MTHKRRSPSTFRPSSEWLFAGDPDTVGAPDAAFVASERAEAVAASRTGFVAEVVSAISVLAQTIARWGISTS